MQIIVVHIFFAYYDSSLPIGSDKIIKGTGRLVWFVLCSVQHVMFCVHCEVCCVELIVQYIILNNGI